MYEMTPILSTTPSSYMPAATNTSSAAPAEDDNGSGVSSTNSVDSRRYTQFDRTATEAGTTTMSFDDFVDMVNPLQHIPVLSALYRSLDGDTINPVSRVVGDIMYSGPMGAVSAAISGLGAIANNILESQTGNDVTGTVLASLFGTDDQAATSVASNETNIPTAVTAQQMPVSLVAATMAAPLKPQAPQNIAKAADTKDAKIETESASENNDTESDEVEPITKPQTLAAAEAPPQTDSPMINNLVGSTGTKFLPLDRNRVTNVANAAANIESQNRIIALSEGSHAMRLGHMIYTNPLMNGLKPIPNRPAIAPANTDAPKSDATATNVATKPVSSTDNQVASAPPPSSIDAKTPLYMQGGNTTQQSLLSAQSSNIPPELFDDVMILKRINQYKSFATAPTTSGITLDITN